MTRDTEKQSVKCEHSHRWIKADNYDQHQLPIQARIVCAVCKANPKAKEVEQVDAVVDLRDLLKPGMTVYTTLRHVSRSGMQRVIDLHVIVNNEPRWIGYTAAKAMGDRYDDRRQGVVAGGCGMDMGFNLVYNLSRTLFQNNFECIGEGDGYTTRCPSNDHSNRDRNYKPHQHSDGGYALRQRWI